MTTWGNTWSGLAVDLRTVYPSWPAAGPLTDVLDRHLWISIIGQDHMVPPDVKIAGYVKPDPAAGTAIATGFGLIAAYHAIVRTAEAAGVRWVTYPKFELFADRVKYDENGRQEVTGMRAYAEFLIATDPAWAI